MSFTASGVFGNGFSFTGFTVSNRNLNFVWQEPHIGVDLFVYSFDIPTTKDSHVGDGFEGTKPFLFSCDRTCRNAFVLPGDRTNENGLAIATWLGPSDPVTTPEPSSVFLIGSGLVGLGLLAKNKRTRKISWSF
jgi:hypothetical protein